MKKEIETASPRTDLYYELAASSRSGSVRIYGQSLDEICRRHAELAARAGHPDLRAIEQGHYASFMLQQLDRLSDPRPIALKRIVALLEQAVATLEKSQNRPHGRYRPIVRTFSERLAEALRLSDDTFSDSTAALRNK